MNERFYRIVFVIIGLVAFTLTAACSPVAAEPVPVPDPVTLHLKWIHQAQFAGYYIAAEKGFYLDENIDISFIPGGPGIDNYASIKSGNAQFAVVRPEAIFTEHVGGADLRAIATIFQRNPFLLVSLASSGIEDPYDIPGHTAALGGTASNLQVNAMFANLGIDMSDIEVSDFNFNYDQFYSGEIDVFPAFAAGSLQDLLRAGVDVNYIWPDDYGVHWYSDTIITTETLIQDNPDLVLRFLRATLRGHRYMIENIEEAVDSTMKYADVQDRQVQTDMLAASIPLIHTGVNQIGWMDEAKWRGMQTDLLEFDVIAESVDLQSVMDMQFLEVLVTETQ
jgi:NitT/TauT family transport system substrate-binding protein